MIQDHYNAMSVIGIIVNGGIISGIDAILYHTACKKYIDTWNYFIADNLRSCLKKNMNATSGARKYVSFLDTGNC